MASERPDAALKKGTAELLVLAQLEDRARHGYEIAQQIATRADGAVSFHAASLYPILYKLEGPRPHRRTLGREGRPAAAPLLPPDPRGSPRAGRAAEELEHLHAGREAGGGARLCVISALSSASSWRRSPSHPSASTRLSRSGPRSSPRSTTGSAPTASPTTTHGARCSGSFPTGPSSATICSTPNRLPPGSPAARALRSHGGHCGPWSRASASSSPRDCSATCTPACAC